MMPGMDRPEHPRRGPLTWSADFYRRDPVALLILIGLLTLSAIPSLTLSLVMAGALPWLFPIF